MSRNPALSFRPGIEVLEDRCVLSGGLSMRPHPAEPTIPIRGLVHHAHVAHHAHQRPHHHQAVTVTPTVTPPPAPMATPMSPGMGMTPTSPGMGWTPMY